MTLKNVIRSKDFRYASLLVVIILLMLAVRELTAPKAQKPTPDSQYVDHSWLTGYPCRAPCWYGLVPQKSTKTEALAKVKELTFLKSDQPHYSDMTDWVSNVEERVPVENIYFECQKFFQVNNMTNCAILTFRKDILDGIIIVPNHDVTFEEAVKSIGEPSEIDFGRINPEGKGCFVSLIWEKRLRIIYSEQPHMFGWDLCDQITAADYKVPPNLDVFSVHYYMNKKDASPQKHDDLPWKGFIGDH